MRAGEAWSIKWIDIDFANNTVRLNKPEKNSNARIFKVSNKLITILDQLPKKTEKVFNGRLNSCGVTFMKLRKRLAHKLDNPRLLEISFHTFRHWKATMEYHKTKDILHVKQLLGHRKIDSIMIYINLESVLFYTQNNEFHVKTAETQAEIEGLLEVGFEYVTEMEDYKLFRKRK